MPAVPRLLFPQRPPDARRSLLHRLGFAVGIILFIAGLTWLGRDGYADADGSPVSLLDAVYYATVTATTTGYGDIAPTSAGARAVTAIVVTPLRILFLIVLVGTTIELLTERFRQTRLERRWRARMTDHTIVSGYGTMGRGAVETLLADGTVQPEQIVVLDQAGSATTEAREAGFVAINADATRTTAWVQARIETARAVIVTCGRDDTAALVTLTARELNPRAVIAAAVREAENAHLLRQSGATSVVLSSEAAGRLVGLSTQSPRVVNVLESLLEVGEGFDLAERPVASAEIGGPPQADGGIPIALVRDGRRITFGDEAFGHAAAGDVVVSIVCR